jgi:hypothetical protein
VNEGGAAGSHRRLFSFEPGSVDINTRRIRRAFIHLRLPVHFRYVLGLQIARAYALVFMILVEPITGQIGFRNESFGRRPIFFFSGREHYSATQIVTTRATFQAPSRRTPLLAPPSPRRGLFLSEKPISSDLLGLRSLLR